MKEGNKMTKEKKLVLLISIIIGFVILLTCILSGISLYNNWKEKNSDGELYIVIKQYEVEDEHFKIGDEGTIIFEALFTDDLYYYKKIETKYGYNIVLIENGKAAVIEANCPNPHSLNGCMSSFITNDLDLLSNSLIRCMQHGISIGWEVRARED